MRALLLVVLGVLLLSFGSADARKRKRIAVTHEVKQKESKKRKTGPQSFGAPWAGALDSPTRFRAPERAHMRRPHRGFATRTTIEHTRRAFLDTLASFPKLHTLAVGDFSEVDVAAVLVRAVLGAAADVGDGEVTDGGRITEHSPL